MTLKETWKECLRMWKWIAENSGNGGMLDLKNIWLSINGFGHIINSCFFCDYAKKHRGSCNCGYCTNCPAQKIDPDFCCQNPGTHWAKNPEEFYELLVKLNKKRLSKKGKKNVCN